ncbi:diguanylate cyclase [Tepidiphilus baoligensis]|uniref:diguanylate cyclase n=1 Tax=Tepidiphilus baoligensis TaxID=2698687 RepID=UPI0036064AC5
MRFLFPLLHRAARASPRRERPRGRANDPSRLAWRLVGLFVLSLVIVASAHADYRLGVFGHRPQEMLQRQWQPLADELSQALGEPVILEVLTPESLDREIAARRIDFLFTNPVHYIQEKYRHAFSGPIATLITVEHGIKTAALGGVILVRRDGPIRRPEDLKGRRILIPGAKGLGGYLAQAGWLLERGVRVPDDVTLLPQGNHDAVVQALLEGKGEAGFVRTGLLEALTREGRLSAEDRERLMVLGEWHPAGFPYRVTTSLYPEWAFVALPHVSPEVARKVALALYTLTDRLDAMPDPRFLAAGIGGFTVPADYSGVERLAQRLRVPPFEHVEVELRDVLHQYAIPLVLLACSAFLLVLLTLRLWHTRRQLEHQRARLASALVETQTILETVDEAIYGTDEQGRCIFFNRAAAELLGFRPEEVLGKVAHDLFHARRPDGQPYPREECPLLRAIAEGKKVRQDDVFWRVDGLPVPVHVSASPRFEHGRSVGIVVAFHDITEEMRLVEELRRLAAYDPLTGLANRGHLEQRLQEAQSLVQRNKQPAALLMFDLDHFKKVNDTYGHAAGDKMLQAFARVLRHNLRPTDFIARYGGEEFIAILPDTSLDTAVKVAERVRQAWAQTHIPLDESGKILSGTVSIGVAPLEPDAPLDESLSRVDEAMYRAKREGRNQVALPPLHGQRLDVQEPT